MPEQASKPTINQAKALRKFKVSEKEISAMTFTEASARLDALIREAQARDSRKDTIKVAIAPSTAKPEPSDQQMLERWIDECIALIENKVAGRPDIDCQLLAQMVGVRYGLWSIRKVAKEKRENIERVERNKRGE